jgi:hypothetical protein
MSSTIKKKPVKKIVSPPKSSIIFPEVEDITDIKYDLNFLSIRKKIIKIGKMLHITKDKEGKSLWIVYCDWFNSTFNNGEIK